jgi:hypothetical protein
MLISQRKKDFHLTYKSAGFAGMEKFAFPVLGTGVFMIGNEHSSKVTEM